VTAFIFTFIFSLPAAHEFAFLPEPKSRRLVSRAMRVPNCMARLTRPAARGNPSRAATARISASRQGPGETCKYDIMY
jgi:hypothetical protein